MAMDLDRTTKFAPVEPRIQRRGAFAIPAHVRAVHTPEGATVLDILRGQMFRLNLVGSRILEFLKQGSAESEIAERLAGEFGIERTAAETDVREFFQMLEKYQLLTAGLGNSSPELE
jgi:hypothetical protein